MVKIAVIYFSCMCIVWVDVRGNFLLITFFSSISFTSYSNFPPCNDIIYLFTRHLQIFSICCNWKTICIRCYWQICMYEKLSKRNLTALLNLCRQNVCVGLIERLISVIGCFINYYRYKLVTTKINFITLD